MSFLSKHLAEQTGTVDPVAGKHSPHHGTQHHEAPQPAAPVPHRVVMGADHKEIRETSYEHQEYPKMLHHQETGDTQIVQDEAEHQAAGSEWGTTPKQETSEPEAVQSEAEPQASAPGAPNEEE